MISLLAKDCLEAFKVECDLRRLSPRTTKGYYNNTALFLTYLEKHEQINQLESLSHLHIKKYVQYLLKKNLSPSYINGILKCLQAYFMYGRQYVLCLNRFLERVPHKIGNRRFFLIVRHIQVPAFQIVTGEQLISQFHLILMDEDYPSQSHPLCPPHEVHTG